MNVVSDIQLHKGQRRIIKSVLKNPVRYNTINATRQFGKSVLGREIINYFSFNFKEYEKHILHPRFYTQKCKIIWTSPTVAQAKKVYTEFENAWSEILVYKSKTDRILITINGTQVRFYGVDKPDNIRGDNCNYMICDEFAFYKDNVFNEVLRPMLLVEGKMVFFISTPKGMNEFYNMHQKGISDEYKNYKYVSGVYTENPYYDLEEIEDARKTLPDPIFRQEYLGEFVGGGASVFGDFSKLCILNEWSEPIPTMEYYNGNDIAKQKDYTVSTTIDKNHKVANIWRTRQVDYVQIIEGIVNELQRYKSYSLMEVNGVGDPIYDMVKAKYSQIQPFVTTNQSKQIIVRYLIAACKLGTIKLPTVELCPSLSEQMNMFSFDYSPEKRQIVYKAIDGFHDDDVISLALANMQYMRLNGKV